MNILDLEDKEPKPKKTYASKPASDPEFESVLEAEQNKWKNPKQDLGELFPKVENLARLGVAEAYPRKSVHDEDIFTTHRRERITEVLMETGNQDYINRIESVLKIFDDPDNILHERDTIIKKLGTYGADAGDLIGWIADCEFLVGSSRREGLLQIRLDQVFHGQQEKAIEEIVKHQASIDAGIDAKGVVKKMAPSSMLLSADMVKGWIINNVPEYSELRKDIAVLSTITETLKRILYQLNGSAENMSNLLRTYP